MDLITRTIKRSYTELFVKPGMRQIYQAFFPQVDSALVENFLLDSFIQNPYGISYRHADMQSRVRKFVNGQGELIMIPRASEKTPISEELLAKVAVGLEATDGFGLNEAQIIRKIVEDHVAGHIMTKNRQAIEIFETGQFTAYGVDDSSLNIDFNRDVDLSMTYDFTQVGASFSDAIAEMQDKLRLKGIALSNMFIMCGQNWLTEFQADDSANQAAQNNAINQLLQTPMTPKVLQNTQGFYNLGQVRTRDMLAPVWITSYSPGKQYKETATSAATDWLDPNKAIMGSFDSPRWNVQRGIRVLNGSGVSTTVSGDVVFDQYNEKDPVTDFIRSATRHAFVPANINHTAVSEGTFA